MCDLSTEDSNEEIETTEAGFYNKYRGTHDVNIQVTQL